MNENRWQFWIDVGGTFTDCVALNPHGVLLRHKVLSSGVTKGSSGTGSDCQQVIDPARRNDPPHFWKGYRLRILDAAGQIAGESEVTDFNRATGRLRLAPALPLDPRVGSAYELVSHEEAPLVAIRYFLQLPLNARLPSVAVRLGTTRGTNALLTRRGAKTAFITTRGFGDILAIGYQNRPRLFDLDIKKKEPLYCSVVEIDERLTPQGEVLQSPQPNEIQQQLESLRAAGIESVAICLLNAYAQPQHEYLVEKIARNVGFTDISVSHRVAPLIKIVPRGDTTVLDAYLNPVLRSYVQKISGAFSQDPVATTATTNSSPLATTHDTSFRLLTSAGGLVSASQFTGKDSILSGPAGGVVGFSRVALAAGFPRAIGFDMGGTSTDVSRFDGRYEIEYEGEKAGVRVVAPMMSIETVAAGGGSICRFDGVKMVVGPDSAGADPGPACYGRGGPLTVTDLNFHAGKILPDHFPFPLDRAAVDRRLDEILAQLPTGQGAPLSAEQLVDGFLRIANVNMARAIRSISVAKGYDPREYVLVAFGGAAPQHACAVASELGMTRILNHPDAGVLSAYGIGLANVVRHRVVGVYKTYHADLLRDLENSFLQMEAEAQTEVAAEGVPAEQMTTARSLDLRYQGQDAALAIHADGDFIAFDFTQQYEREHQRLYGYRFENRPIEFVAARVEVTGHSNTQLPTSASAAHYLPPPIAVTSAFFDAKPYATAVYQRETLKPGASIQGPAIIAETISTTAVDPGWTAEMLTGGELVFERNKKVSSQTDEALSSRQQSKTKQTFSTADPILLEIFNNHFAGIAEQMGITLRNTSSSVNVKERLDFSCAIFTTSGDLVVNAPHIPVHLGAMGETVRAIIADNPDLHSGDVFVTNDPYRGGSHLPDITVVTPVHDPANGQLIFFTASRAHHAEIGGITPGSMPPFSKNLAEEGVLIQNFKVSEGGVSRTDELARLLGAGKYPSRSVDQNLADIAAQIAANRQGQRDLMQLVEREGWPLVSAYMGHIQQAAERKMRAALARLQPGRYEFTDHLDDGSAIHVAIAIDGDSATIDFTGTSPVLASNLNANRAIVTAAVMYVLRCLIAEDIPLNQGVLAPVKIFLPVCLLNPPCGESPETSPAIVGGNVETSQRTVDVLLGALGLAAASQGTMNNLLFGDATFGYYETICGGAGATANAAGANAIHTHMTNTRLTDPEVLERRFPIRVREFSIRRGSGGTGQHRGGDGVIRRLEFLRPLQVSLLTQRRGPYPPYGIQGGEPGSLGKNELLRAGSTNPESLPAACRIDVSSGDILTIETPGGGGWGAVPAGTSENSPPF